MGTEEIISELQRKLDAKGKEIEELDRLVHELDEQLFQMSIKLIKLDNT